MLRESSRRRRRALSSREDADDVDGGGERARGSGGSNNGIRGETRRPTNVVHVANISSRITGHHVREIFNAYQLNAKRREGDHGDDDGGGIENVTFGPGRAFCRVQFREVEDAEYARENLDGGEIDGKKIKVVFVDSALVFEPARALANEGDAQRLRGDLDAAAKLYDHAIEAGSRNELPWCGKGQVALCEGVMSTAVA